MTPSSLKSSRVITWCYFAFVITTALACYYRPVADEFDRYMYEAIVRQRNESWDKVYVFMKHTYSRFQQSEVADSAEHMAQLEPMYSIRPLYLLTIDSLDRYLKISPQHAISLISAMSLVVIATILFRWTRQPLLCAAIVATQPIVQLGRFGTPDGFSSAFVIAGCYAAVRDRIMLALVLLLSSIYLRTDNVILVLILLAWLTLVEKRLTVLQSLTLAAIVVASVAFINRLSGNYGWAVLFRHTFMVKSKFPVQVLPHVSLHEYLRVLEEGCIEVATRFAPWMILGLVAWKYLDRGYQWLLGAISASVLIHFLLYPSAQDRYYAWSYVIVAASLGKSLEARKEVSTSKLELPEASPRLVENGRT